MIKYFSTFSGCGVIEKALLKKYPSAKCVGYSEIDKFANVSYLKNFPQNTGLNVGDIKSLTRDEEGKISFDLIEKNVPDMDFLFGGPPCQDLSIAKGKRKGLSGDKSSLFYDFLAILLVKKPKFFIMENVASMTKANRDLISVFLGIEVHKICSDHYTAQKRNRLYWYNWEDITPPKEGWRWDNLVAWSASRDYDKDGNFIGRRERETRDGRANTLTTGRGCGGQSSMNYIEEEDGTKRPLTCEEAEILQGLPPGWTLGSPAQRFKQVGNAITYDVVEQLIEEGI